MQGQVKILADDMGNVIRQSSNNAEYGHVRLQQQRVTFSNTSWVRNSNVTALIHGKVEDLQALNLNANDSLPGKIIIKESLEPFSNNDPDRDLKYAGETGIICCVDGQPIYRKTFFVPDVNAQDVLVAHDNGDAIREANGQSTAVKLDKVTTAEAFGLNADESTTEAEEAEEGSDAAEAPETSAEVDNNDEVEEEVLEEETFEL